MSLFKRRRLRIDITTIFIAVLCVTTLSIIFFTYERNLRAGLDLTEKLIQHTHQTIREQLNIFLRPKVFVNIATQLLDNQVITTKEAKDFSLLIHSAMDSYPQMISVYFADPAGNLYFHHRVQQHEGDLYSVPILGQRIIPPATQKILLQITQQKNTAVAHVFYENAKGDVLQETTESIHYDPRIRPWFTGAVSGHEPYWLGLYKFFTTGKLGISFSSPVYINKVFSGVISVDLDSSSISKQLSEINLGNQANTFIVNHQGDIVAQKKSIYADINSLDNPVIKKAFDLFKQTHKNMFIFSFHHVNYIAVFSLYAFNAEGDWQIATVIPVDVFVGTFKVTNYYTMTFSLIMLVLGVMLVLISAHKISKPVIKLARQMERLKRLDFSRSTHIKSPIYEIQIMSDALHAANVALSSFSKYVPHILVSQMMQHKKIATLGGEKKPVTLLFTDIANFTEITEANHPDVLMQHISEYLNDMSNIIHHYQGNIDKFIGDAIMAFWNDPIPDSEHILHACFAVLECKMRLKKLNALWKKAGKPILITRFGLNTGLAIVGNMGSHDRLNYTVIGDTVNVAARLEALNKVYKTEVIVSKAICQAAENILLFRPLDVVTVRGKRESTVIYELVAAQPHSTSKFAATHQQVRLCALTATGYQAFHSGQYVKAKEIFTALQAQFPDDGVATIYLARCAEFC